MRTSIDELLLQKRLDKLEAGHLQQKVREYKQLISEGRFHLRLHWETDVHKMDFARLKTKVVWRTLSPAPEDFAVMTLDLEKIIKHHSAHPDKLFPKDDLWGARDEVNTARLIEFVAQGHKLIPPIIRVLRNHSVVIIDGHHRIALCRYLGMRQIPFLIKKRYLHNLEGLLKA